MAPRLIWQQLPLFVDLDSGRQLAVPAIGSLRRDWHAFADLHKLTDRERECAERLACDELTDAQLAGKLGVSKQTINIHLGHLRSKLHARSRVGIAQLVTGGAVCDCHPRWAVAPVIVAVEKAKASGA